MKCETCFYSKKTKVFDPIVASMSGSSSTAKEMMEKNWSFLHTGNH